MRALVTGGAGFVGSHVANSLVDAGYHVLVFDDLSSGTHEKPRGVEQRSAVVSGTSTVRVEFIEGRIQDSEAVRAAAQGIDLVFHLAAVVSVPASLKSPANCYEVNLNGSLNVLAAAKEVGATKVVLASTAAIYGESGEPVAENAVSNPLSPYAASKTAMEQAARMYYEVYGLPTVCLRYFNVYGPRQRPDSMYAAVIPAFINAMADGKPPTIFGDGEQKRDFVYIDDVVRANLLAAESDEAIGKILNISGGGAVTINELAGILHEIIPEAPAPVHKPQRDGDIYFSEAVIEQAWRALGYRPEVALAEGLRSTVEWFRQERLQTPP